jgi:hypothetical protein
MNNSDLAAWFGSGERRHPRGGGRRRRFIRPGDADVWLSGRWGRKRLCVSRCAHLMTAETVYDTALRQGTVLAPGSRLRISWGVEGRECEAVAEVRSNAVWRHGRLFLRCPRCDRRATRL